MPKSRWATDAEEPNQGEKCWLARRNDIKFNRKMALREASQTTGEKVKRVFPKDGRDAKERNKRRGGHEPHGKHQKRIQKGW